MIKRLFVGLCMILSAVAFSQENNASPYSYYGIGDQKFKGTAENRAMGGLGVQADSIHLNLQNPASYNSLMLTTFTIGASNTGTTFKTSGQEDKANRTTLDYLAVALPFNKIGVAFGLMPYTSVGYKIQNSALDPADGLTRYRQFEGSGGLNRVFAGAAYNVFKGFSLGADFQYNFGNVETRSLVGVPELVLQYPTREINATNYSGISYNIGLMYNTKITSKLNWFASAAYSPESTLTAKTEREIATISLTNNNDEIVMNSIDVAVADQEVKLPSKLTLGTGFGQSRKWFAGAEYTFQESNKLSNRFDDVTNSGFENSYKIAIGGYYIPNYQAFNSYLSRITYRAGFRYEKTGLVVGAESINDMGVSLGVGLPLGAYLNSSNLNVGVEMGRRGTTNAGLVQEDYIGLYISLSFTDRWFVKRKFD